MRTRREQVQAYRFTTRRIVSAMLSGEPETTDLPMRRLGYAVFASVMVAAIVFAGVGIYGLLNPGGRRPAENALIIERETGARYLYLQESCTRFSTTRPRGSSSASPTRLSGRCRAAR